MNVKAIPIRHFFAKCRVLLGRTRALLLGVCLLALFWFCHRKKPYDHFCGAQANRSNFFLNIVFTWNRCSTILPRFLPNKSARRAFWFCRKIKTKLMPSPPIVKPSCRLWNFFFHPTNFVVFYRNLFERIWKNNSKYHQYVLIEIVQKSLGAKNPFYVILKLLTIVSKNRRGLFPIFVL